MKVVQGAEERTSVALFAMLLLHEEGKLGDVIKIDKGLFFVLFDEIRAIVCSHNI